MYEINCIHHLYPFDTIHPIIHICIPFTPYLHTLYIKRSNIYIYIYISSSYTCTLYTLSINCPLPRKSLQTMRASNGRRILASAIMVVQGSEPGTLTIACSLGPASTQPYYLPGIQTGHTMRNACTRLEHGILPAAWHLQYRLRKLLWTPITCGLTGCATY